VSALFGPLSPAGTFACACGAEAVRVIPCPYVRGVLVVLSNGRYCCSHFEGEFDHTNGVFDLDGASYQAALTEVDLRKKALDQRKVWRAKVRNRAA
jgi:hypothetical protein